jgi:hypothetical protein
MNFKNHYVAFLDVLGFKSISSNVELIEMYCSVIDASLNNLRGVTGGPKLKVLAVSDSIIVASEAYDGDRDYNMESLRSVIAAVREIQAACVLENIWIRGGISYGPLFFAEEAGKIFGQGLVDAYLIESRAKYPRVLIGQGVVSSLNQKWDSAAFLENLNTQSKNIQFDNVDFALMGDGAFPSKDNEYAHNPMNTHLKKDCPFFINYLFNFKSKTYIDKNGEKVFRILRNRIHEEPLEYFHKYNWVAEYLMQLVKDVDDAFFHRLSNI